MKSESGEQFGSFKLLYSCGKGSYGEVFLARSVITGKVFALKKLYQSGELPGVIEYQQICPQTGLMQIYYTGQEGDEFYYVMDAADDLNGGDGDYLPDTLLNRMKRSGRIPPEELRETASSLINACSILHRKGVMHRDIKPGNILYINGIALPGDIGLVASESTGTLVGSAGFIAPEVAAGLRKFAPEDDLYALGKTLYCALTGNPPEKYPAFPEDLSLAECKDIVSLYNKLLSGHYPEKKSPEKKTGGLRYRLWGIAGLILIAVIVIGVQVSNLPERSLPESPEMIFGIADYYAVLEKEYLNRAVPPEMSKIIPLIKAEKEKLEKLKFQRGQAEYEREPSEADLAAIRHEVPAYHSAGTYWRQKNREAAFAEFDREYRDDPALRYYELQSFLQEEFARIRFLKDIPGIESYDCRSDLLIFREKLSALIEVETELLKKLR
ncbi:MAG: serine/threonine-protein kinase [Lentisphaeria bacterium]|nr:serine/threonine-protein kinase [Lentisphaeria bacterium]